MSVNDTLFLPLKTNYDLHLSLIGTVILVKTRFVRVVRVVHYCNILHFDKHKLFKPTVYQQITISVIQMGTQHVSCLQRHYFDVKCDTVLRGKTSSGVEG